MTKPMAWPDREWYEKYSRDDFSGYERAMKEAYAQRLVIAVEALRAVQAESRTKDALWFEGAYDKIASNALESIGPLPEAG